jgi:hypothetical protein
VHASCKTPPQQRDLAHTASAGVLPASRESRLSRAP